MPFGGMSWVLGCETVVRQDLEMTVLFREGLVFFFRMVSLVMLSAGSQEDPLSCSSFPSTCFVCSKCRLGIRKRFFSHKFRTPCWLI